jgi:two-component system, response regulator / RNA-binding antiterminator
MDEARFLPRMTDSGESKQARRRPPLRVVLVDADAARAAVLAEALADQDCELVAALGSEVDLAEQVRTLRPDVIVIDMDSPRRDTLESMRAIHRDQPRPIVMFVDDDDPGLIDQAIRAGVSAYIIDGLDAKRVRPILDVAIARFREQQALRDELEKTKSVLNERKLVERAKGILMAERKLSEEAAYRTLRKLAMDQNKRLVEVAESLIAYAKLLKP